MFELSNCFVLRTIGLAVLTKYSFDSLIIKFQNNVFRTEILQNMVFVFVPVHKKILNNLPRIEQLFNVLETC
jgi:hypothetical protein